jgi:hypothetical protein
MEAYQQRVVDEKAALDDKILRLEPFSASHQFNSLPAAEQERMTRQLGLMNAYSAVLGERIAAFTQAAPSGQAPTGAKAEGAPS